MSTVCVCICVCMHVFLYVWNAWFYVQERQSKRKMCAGLLSSGQLLSELLSLTSLLLLSLWMLNGLPEMDANAWLIVVLIVSVRVSFCTCHRTSPSCSWTDEVPITSTTMLKITEQCMSTQLNDNYEMFIKHGLTTRASIVQETVSILISRRNINLSCATELSSDKAMAMALPLRLTSDFGVDSNSGLRLKTQKIYINKKWAQDSYIY